MYIHTTTLTQHSESDIRAAHPNTSFPDPFIAPDEYALVFPTPQPTYNSVTQRAQETTPVLTAKGHWEQQWTVVSMFTEYTDEAKVLHTVAAQEGASLAVNRATQIEAKITDIKAERDKRKFGGVKVGTQWLHTDTYSRTQWLGMTIMGANIPAISWTTMDGSTVTTSQALAGQVFQGTAKLDAAIFSHAKDLISEVRLADNPALVIITSGWPPTFGEPV